MTGSQFMCIIGTIYITHDMEPEFRKWAGLACFAIAILMEFVS